MKIKLNPFNILHYLGMTKGRMSWTRHAACMENLKGRDHSEDLGVDGRIILK
jgi:hypothetical protein